MATDTPARAMRSGGSQPEVGADLFHCVKHVLDMRKGMQ